MSRAAVPDSALAQWDLPTKPEKMELLDRAHELTGFRSFADLGGCWGVNGAYSFHAAQLCGGDLERAVIVDGNVTPRTTERAVAYPKIELVEGLLGAREAMEAVERVDALIMFDILLHQVAPDWDEFLRLWSKRTRAIVVFNQNWLKTPRTIRFVDRGFDWYYENVYVWEDQANTRERLRQWFERHHVRGLDGRLERDSHWYWQFGIRPLDLITLLAGLGFELAYMKRYRHPFGANRPWIVNDAMVFQIAAYPELGPWRRLRAGAREFLARTGTAGRSGDS